MVHLERLNLEQLVDFRLPQWSFFEKMTFHFWTSFCQLEESVEPTFDSESEEMLYFVMAQPQQSLYLNFAFVRDSNCVANF